MCQCPVSGQFVRPVCIIPIMLHCAADYDAPVAENGDLTEKYFIIQKVLREMLPNSEGLLRLI